MQLISNNFHNNAPIPGELAFAVIGEPVTLSSNRSPHLAWKDVPDGTRSFVLTCIDVDGPTRADDVNKDDREVPADLPRTEFVHWLMANIPRECRELAEGSCSDGIEAHGKRAPVGPPGVVQGMNDYTDWFADDSDMAGEYRGYDGPCPPWNDALRHRYHFTIHALQTASLALPAGFDLAALRAAIDGQVLATAELTGIYTLNKKLAASG